MARFETRYTDDMFLSTLQEGVSKSTTAIKEELKCSRNTVKAAMLKLEAEGKVKRIEVAGSIYGWKKVKE
jgi:DNA-binding Lrp family transcriptional regulator